MAFVGSFSSLTSASCPTPDPKSATRLLTSPTMFLMKVLHSEIEPNVSSTRGGPVFGITPGFIMCMLSLGPARRWVGPPAPGFGEMTAKP